MNEQELDELVMEISESIADASRDLDGQGINEDDIAHDVMVSMIAGHSPSTERAVRQALGFTVWEDDNA